MAQKRFQVMSLDDLADRIALVSQGQPGHIVDQLIAERGQKIVKNPLWPVMRPFLHILLHYRQAIEFADGTVWDLDTVKEMVLQGTNSADSLYGYAGDDTIAGLGGNDRLYGGDGEDTLSGDFGNDYLYGQDGNDQLDGGAGNDYLSGGNDDDTLRGGAGDDRLYGDNGNDVLNGRGGNDCLLGGKGLDILLGGAGQDLLRGGAGDDYLYGELGDDKNRLSHRRAALVKLARWVRAGDR